jgi:hypothetical protein
MFRSTRQPRNTLVGLPEIPRGGSKFAGVARRSRIGSVRREK